MSTSLAPSSIDSIHHSLSALEMAISAFFQDRASAEDGAVYLIQESSSLQSITSDQDREMATHYMRQAASGAKLAGLVCAKNKKAAYDLWKSFCAAENALLAEFGSVRERLEPMALQYDAEREKARKMREEQMRAEAGDSPVFIAKPETPKGETKAVRWTAEVSDLATLVKAVADGKAPLPAIQADMSFLKREANNRKQHFDIPGVSARPEESLRIRA